MISVMRTKLGQNVEEMLERWCFKPHTSGNMHKVFIRDNVLGKLDELREITSKTQQPPGHQVKSCVTAANLVLLK